MFISIHRSGKAEMAAIYYEKIDVEGHHFGPDSHQIKTAVRELDTAMQTLNKKIKVHKILYLCCHCCSSLPLIKCFIFSLSFLNGSYNCFSTGEEHGGQAERHAVL